MIVKIHQKKIIIEHGFILQSKELIVMDKLD